MEFESNPRIKRIWERFLDCELGHLHMVIELFKKFEGRDPAEVLPARLPESIEYRSQRAFVREVLASEVDLRARGAEFIDKSEEKANSPSVRYRKQMNSEGSPSDTVAQSYIWTPGTELNKNGKLQPMKRAS